MPAVHERSAGVVCHRKVGGGPGGFVREYLLLDHGRHRDFPKGHVEAGETDRDAALRELAEETGLSVLGLDADFAREVGYFFRDRRGRLVRKTVVFFLGEVAPDAAVTISHEHVGFQFLPLEEALRRLSHAGPREVLRAADAHLNGQPNPADARASTPNPG